MSDRTNPIKFGPEWLRNLSSESTRSGGQGGSGRDGAGSGVAPPGMNNLTAPHRPVNTNSSTNPNTNPNTNNNPNTNTNQNTNINPNINTHPNANTSKVLLAKLRYGREEMLALYDRQTAEAPAMLKNIEMLYQPKGNAPLALNYTCDDDLRDNMSRQPPIGGLSSGDRYAGMGRGRGSNGENRGRGLSSGDSRGKTRGYNRQTSAGRGWHGNQRNAYSGMSDDDPSQPLRPWNTNNQLSSNLRPNNGEQPDWQSKQQPYRMKRQTSTNWRQQQNREEGEEWRSTDGSRRPQDKWEWGWQQESTGRPNLDKQWHTNRRTWVGGDANEDALPEWAVENAEAGGGTFDSSGAFHGYSNDDSNLPKNQDTTYPLTRSHTHGNFARSKTVEEGSEEWWASEKAKKLSPKRFDASEIQFKKPQATVNADEKTNTNSAGSTSSGSNGYGYHSTGAIPKNSYQKMSSDRSSKDRSTKKSGSKDNDEDSPENKNSIAVTAEPEENKQKPANNTSREKLSNNNDKPDEEKSSFQSVKMTSNNVLRKKHQVIVLTPCPSATRKPITQYLDTTHQSRQLDNDEKSQKENDKIVEDILQMSLDDGIPSATMNQLLTNRSSSAMTSLAQLPNSSLQMHISNPLQGLGLNANNKQSMPPSSNMQPSGVQSSMMQPIGITNSMLNASLGLPLPNSSTGLPLQGMTPSGLSNSNMLASGLQSMGGGNMQASGLQSANMQTAGMQSGQASVLQVGGLQMPGLQGNGMQSGGTLQNNMSVGGMSNNGLLSGGSGLPGFQSAAAAMPSIGNNSLFNNMQHASNLSNHGAESVSSLHNLQQYSSHSFNNFMYANILSQPPPPPPPLPNMGRQHVSGDMWYYEDPNKTIQGPFTSKEMLHWYRAGFFCPTLMVRRDRDTIMRPLGAFGHMPFGLMEFPPQFTMGGGYDFLPQQSHDNMMNTQPGLGIDVSTSNGYQFHQPSYVESNMPYDPSNPNQLQIEVAVESVGPMRPVPDLLPPLPQPLPMPPFQLVQNNEMESLWGQPTNNAPAPDLMWMQSMDTNSVNESHTNKLPMYYWGNQPSDSQPLLPETIKTEEDILAQMQAGQAQGPTSPLSFLADTSASSPDIDFAANAALNMDQLQKIIQKEENATPAAGVADANKIEPQKPEQAEVVKVDMNTSDSSAAKPVKASETKPVKEVAKVDNGKSKGKDNPSKPKSKNKTRDEKKDEPTEIKLKEEDVVEEKRSAESSPTAKNKKEDKSTKKDSEKEKKEWIKEGFTIVKGAEKIKDNKKKAEEAKIAEEAERKRKEEEKLAAEEKKRLLEIIRNQHEMQQQQQQPMPQPMPQRQVPDLVIKKAPWSASSQGLQSSPRDGPTLAEIQRLEREKKLEQIKEQQQMMQIIAQQQAAAMAREQAFNMPEMHAGLGWAKKSTSNTPNQTLAEIQAEARKQATAAAIATAAAAATAAREEAAATSPPSSNVPWASVQNGGGGFWDSPPTEPAKPAPSAPKQAEFVKPEPKPKKKVTVMAPPKPENTPAVEFDMWCTNMLTSWRDTSIDIPTFVTFLKDIESPYEVKDYVKCYLGDSREAGEFARQFLERRSRLLRVGMVTPSDDLCSPAAAINPRTNSGSDYTEVKGKGKKTKKNKMLKVDARNILGFSVTASEDRINVGDIDTV